MKMKAKFKVGMVRTRQGLYGSSWSVECTARLGNTAVFEEVDYPGEGVSYDIELDTEGNEVCEIWDYKGNKAYISSVPEIKFHPLFQEDRD